MNLDEHLKTAGEYADRVARAEQYANNDSMRAAEALEAIYEAREWVAEWLEQAPRPKSGGSNRWQADSRNRFSQWLAWKLSQLGHATLTGARTYQLLQAPRIARALNFNSVEIRSEYAIRPLAWVLRNRYEDRLPEVAAIVREHIDNDPAQLTAKTSREALKKWQAKTFTRRDGAPRKSPAAISAAATAAGKANRLRMTMLDEVAELYRLACIGGEKAQAEFTGFLDDLEHFLDEHRIDAA